MYAKFTSGYKKKSLISDGLQIKHSQVGQKLTAYFRVPGENNVKRTMLLC